MMFRRKHLLSKISEQFEEDEPHVNEGSLTQPYGSVQAPIEQKEEASEPPQAEAYARPQEAVIAAPVVEAAIAITPEQAAEYAPVKADAPSDAQSTLAELFTQHQHEKASSKSVDDSDDESMDATLAAISDPEPAAVKVPEKPEPVESIAKPLEKPTAEAKPIATASVAEPAPTAIAYPEPKAPSSNITIPATSIQTTERNREDIMPAPATQPANTNQTQDAASSSKNMLSVGPATVLKGEIQTCERVVIEGTADVTVKDVRVLVISQTGRFTGTATVESAEIDGAFDGDLNVTGRLTIRGNGNVSGKIAYGEIEINSGGKLRGEIAVSDSDEKHPSLKAVK